MAGKKIQMIIIYLNIYLQNTFISTIFGAMSAKVNTIIDFFFGGSSKKNNDNKDGN